MSAVQIEYTEPAEADMDNAYQWLLRFGFEVAEHWLTGIVAAIEEEAERLGSPIGFRRPIVSNPGEWEGREVFAFVFRTSHRGSPWRVFYEFADTDNDGQADTLKVLRIRHAATGY